MAQDWMQKSVQRIKDPSARKAAYYKLQRENAQETDDTATLGKINKKTNKNFKTADPDAVNKGILGSVAAFAGGGPEGLLGKLGSRFAGGAIKRAGTALAERAGGAVKGAEKVFQDLGRARPVGNKLTSGARVASKTEKAAKPAVSSAVRKPIFSTAEKKAVGAAKAKPKQLPGEARKALPPAKPKVTSARGKTAYSASADDERYLADAKREAQKRRIDKLNDKLHGKPSPGSDKRLQNAFDNTKTRLEAESKGSARHATLKPRPAKAASAKLQPSVKAQNRVPASKLTKKK